MNLLCWGLSWHQGVLIRSQWENVSLPVRLERPACFGSRNSCCVCFWWCVACFDRSFDLSMSSGTQIWTLVLRQEGKEWYSLGGSAQIVRQHVFLALCSIMVGVSVELSYQSYQWVPFWANYSCDHISHLPVHPSQSRQKPWKPCDIVKKYLEEKGTSIHVSTVIKHTCRQTACKHTYIYIYMVFVLCNM